MTFSCPTDQVKLAKESLEKGKNNKILDYYRLDIDTQVSKISIVGIGMRSHSGIAQTMFKTLGDENINIKVKRAANNIYIFEYSSVLAVLVL